MIIYPHVSDFEEKRQTPIKKISREQVKSFEDFPPSAGTPLILPSLKTNKGALSDSPFATTTL